MEQNYTQLTRRTTRIPTKSRRLLTPIIYRGMSAANQLILGVTCKSIVTAVLMQIAVNLKDSIL